MQPSRPTARTGGVPRTLACVLLGAAALTASAFYAAPLLKNGTGSKDSSSSAPPADSGVAIGFGHVDVERGLSKLHPAQPGRVTAIPAQENVPLKKGDVLVQVDDEAHRLLVAEAQADLKAAEADLAKAEKLPAQHAEGVKQQKAAVEAARHEKGKAEALLARLVKRIDAKIEGSKEERDAAEEAVKQAAAAVKVQEAKLAALELLDPALEVERAQSAVAARRSKLKQAEHAVEECKLRAPAAGAVLRLQVAVGDLLGPNSPQPAVLFCPSEKRIVRAEIEQEFAARVRVGEHAELKDYARLEGKWAGKVKSVSDWYTQRRSILLEPRQFNDVRTLECIIELDSDADLKIGQRMIVTIGK
jgi:multidrug resistance efflux pump